MEEKQKDAKKEKEEEQEEEETEEEETGEEEKRDYDFFLTAIAGFMLVGYCSSGVLHRDGRYLKN